MDRALEVDAGVAGGKGYSVDFVAYDFSLFSLTSKVGNIPNLFLLMASGRDMTSR